MAKHTKARHRLPARHDTRPRVVVSTIEVVDTAGTAHRVSIDAAADGLSRGRYATLCGDAVLPAALVAGAARVCRLCAPVPTQRSGSRR